MTATHLGNLRVELSECYIATHGYLSTDKVDELPRTRHMKRTYSAPFFALQASTLCPQIVAIRVRELGENISAFVSILDTEMAYFESLRFFSNSLDAIRQPLITALNVAVNREGTRQVTVMLQNPETLSIDKIRSIFRQIDTVYKWMGCTAPERPITASPTLEIAINRSNSEVAKELQVSCQRLEVPIVCLNGEMLPGITVNIPKSTEIHEAVWQMGKTVNDALRRIRVEFRRRIAILKENNLLDVLDDSSPFSKTPLRRRLENLRIRHDAIQDRFFSHSESLEKQQRCLSEISLKTSGINTEIVWYPPLNLYVGLVTDEMSREEQALAIH